MPVLSSSRRKAAALVAVVAIAYGAGMLSGPPAAPASTTAAPGSSDAVAARILDTGAGGLAAADLDPATVPGLIARLDDRWAAYFDPTQYARFEQSIDGHYTGVGVFVRRNAAGEVYLASVQQGSPADRAGLAVGDVVEDIGGRRTAAMSVADISAALRGEVGTLVTVTVGRAGVFRTVTMPRVVMTSGDVTVTRLHADVVKITVTSFTRGVGKKVRDAVAHAHGSGIVLDLRGNPGGLLHEAVEVASAFLADGPVVTFVRQGAAPEELDAVGDADATVPLVVLVDGGTASAAEVVAAALQDRERAAIIGSQTFGKGTVQQPTRLSNGAGMEFTVGTYLTPDGHSVDGVGLTPDIQVAGGSSPAIALQRADAVLTGLMADAHTAGRG